MLRAPLPSQHQTAPARFRISGRALEGHRRDGHWRGGHGAVYVSNMAPITLDMIRRRAEHNEGMVGFTRMFHEDLRNGFDAVNEERFPWLGELEQAPWSWC